MLEKLVLYVSKNKWMMDARFALGGMYVLIQLWFIVIYDSAWMVETITFQLPAQWYGNSTHWKERPPTHFCSEWTHTCSRSNGRDSSCVLLSLMTAWLYSWNIPGYLCLHQFHINSLYGPTTFLFGRPHKFCFWTLLPKCTLLSNSSTVNVLMHQHVNSPDTANARFMHSYLWDLICLVQNLIDSTPWDSGGVHDWMRSVQ
jgi:hypothetical protein